MKRKLVGLAVIVGIVGIAAVAMSQTQVKQLAPIKDLAARTSLSGLLIRHTDCTKWHVQGVNPAYEVAYKWQGDPNVPGEYVLQSFTGQCFDTKSAEDGNVCTITLIGSKEMGYAFLKFLDDNKARVAAAGGSLLFDLKSNTGDRFSWTGAAVNGAPNCSFDVPVK